MAECEDYKTLTDTFIELLKEFDLIESSDKPVNSDYLQIKIRNSIEQLEKLTIQVSYYGVFSINETLEDLGTESIKFLLIPALLGFLNLKLVDHEREEHIKVARIYFLDFFKRCSSYGIASTEVCLDEAEKCEDSSKEQKVDSNQQRPTPQDLKNWANDRERKIKRYKEKMELKKELQSLKVAVDNRADDEVLRTYYLTLIRQYFHNCEAEMESISLEQKLLKHKSEVSVDDSVKNYKPSQPLRPFLLTKDDVQKRVFGAGYPSLPVLSVEEFYEQRVRDGWFPSTHSGKSISPSVSGANSNNGAAAKAENDDDADEGEEEEKSREKLVQRDEWRDTHRTGWGNTYNRS